MERRDVLRWSMLPMFGLIKALPMEPSAQADGSVSRPQQVTLLAEDVQLSGIDLTTTVTRLRLQPGASSPPHRHSGFVAGCVAAGAVTFQVAGQPARTYKEGEAFWEPVDAVHQRFENPSSVPAIVVAVHVGRAGQPVVLPVK